MLRLPSRQVHLDFHIERMISMQSDNIDIKYQGLWTAISEMKIVDSHFHLTSPDAYFKGDVNPIFSNEGEIDELIQSADNFSYRYGSFRNIGLSMLCLQFANSGEISRESLLTAREALKKRYYREGGLEQALDDAAIAYILDDPCVMSIQSGYPVTRMKFKIRMDFFTQICSFEDLLEIQKFTGSIIHNLDDLLEAAEKMIVEAKKQGATVIKNYQAYFRNMRFNSSTHYEAEKCLNKILSEDRYAGWDKYIRYSPDEMQALGDFMVHYFCMLAAKHNMVVAFHTGPILAFTAGPNNLLQLNNLFTLYPDVHFNLMHGNLPYYQDAAYIASRMNNVSIDLCWCHQLSTAYSLEALYFWIGMAPINRIIGYGTDGGNIEEIWWCSRLARKTTYQAIARHIDEGRFSENDAIKIAAMILHDNPSRIFGFK